MIRRNPAFRIAMGGLIVSVLLCLVGAISLVSSTPRADVAEADAPSATETSAAEMPIQVASAGDAHGLLKDHPQKPVPEPVEYPTVGHADKVPAETTPLGSGPPSLPTEERAQTAPALISRFFDAMTQPI